MGETFHEMSEVDRVNRDSENVFSISVFKEEPTMPVSLYLNTKYHVLFISSLSFNFGNKSLPVESRKT